MTKYITYTIFLIIFSLTISYAQEHPLPLKIASIESNYVEDVLSETEFEVYSDDEKIPKTIGLRYEIIIDFVVEDSDFLLNPTFRIFMSDWNNDIWWIDIDSSKIVSEDNKCLSVSYMVDVTDLGWLYCYCFPNSIDFHPASIWDLKKGTDIQMLVYLR